MDKIDAAEAAPSSTEPAIDVKPSGRAHQRRSRLVAWIEKFHWRAFWLFPRWVPHPYGTDRDHAVARDAELNQETRVPEERKLRVGMVWGVELYGPAEIENLYAGLRKLNWSPVGQGRSIQDWIQHQRAFGYGGWLNIGYVRDRSDRARNSMIRNFTRLPDGVSTMVVRCHQITPSLTGIIIGFELSDAAARCYENELNRDRTTVLKRDHPFSVMHWSPDHQKLESVSEARANLRRTAGDWFKQHLPGFFSTLERREAFPTMEMLMVESGSILHDEAVPEKSFFGWRRLITRTLPWDVWSCDEAPALELAVSPSSEDDHGFHIKVALDRSKLVEDEMAPWGGRTLQAVVHKFNDELEGLLVHASALQYLREQSRDIKLTRVALKKARSGFRSVTRTITEIGLYFDRTLGSPAITRELVKKSESENAYLRDFPKFSMPSSLEAGVPLDLSEVVRSQVHYLASRVNEDEAALRAHIEQISSILSVRESIRAQRRMEWLTITAVIVAIATLLVGLPNAARILKKFDPGSQPTAETA